VTGSNVGHVGGDSSSSSTTSDKGSKTSATPIVVTSTNAGQTVIVTVQPTADPATSNGSNSGGGGSNTAGIAAGVVVGVAAIAGIMIGIYFFMRHKRRREAEEDFKARTQVDQFRNIGEFKAPGTAYSGMSDQRLDPEAGRRNSVGSLADNQDYSRRILRVSWE
jgi:cell wall integrity and stress response component